MRRAHSLLLGLATAALVGGAALDAQAQNAGAEAAPAGEARGLRYLSWSGRPQPSATVSSAPEAGRAPTDVRRDLRRPNRVIPHGGSAAALASPRATPTPVPAPPPASAPIAPPPDRAAPTPANAWMRSAAPQPSAPQPPVRTEPAPSPPPVQPAARALPDYLPEQGGRGQPLPADLALSAPQPAPLQPEYAPSDPMAPRRDAPIFRMQQQTPPPPPPAPQAAADAAEPETRTEDAPPQPRRIALVTANPDDRPAPQGARRYSVHRQNGQTPDALTIPQPTYIDALAVSMAETPASQDLAQPDAGPTLIRDAQGRIRHQPAAPEGDYQ